MFIHIKAWVTAAQSDSAACRSSRLWQTAVPGPCTAPARQAISWSRTKFERSQWYWQNIRVVRISVARALHFSVLFLDRRRAGVVARTRQVARGPRGLEPYGAPVVPCQRAVHRQGGTRERRDPRPACSHRHTTVQLPMVRFSHTFGPDGHRFRL